MPTTELVRIGIKFTLWEVQFKSSKDPLYIDQFGIPHDGYLVVNEFRVEIVEVVPVFSTHDRFMHFGWRATCEEGLEFRNDPPCWYILNQPDKPYREFKEACSAYNSRAAVWITTTHQLAKPRDAYICVNHNYAFDSSRGENCHQCSLGNYPRM